MTDVPNSFSQETRRHISANHFDTKFISAPDEMRKSSLSINNGWSENFLRFEATVE